MNFSCPICGKTEFENVDQFRIRPSGMSICVSCGFVTYPELAGDEKKLHEYYLEEYRDAPNFGNVTTGERKLHYHSAFLEPLFKKWRHEKLESPAVAEIGSAFGMFLHWFRMHFPKGSFHGTELTTSYVRVAKHLYDLDLVDKIDESKKYDLICSYKVAEHQPKIDEELAKYRRLLNDGGYLYISVPIWWEALTNFGAQGFSVEYYYHKNHINVWSRKHFEYLLKKSGFQICQENHVFYDSTYLCKAGDFCVDTAPAQYSEVKEKMEAIIKAFKLFENGQYQEAVAVYPQFPDAYLGLYESQRGKLHALGYDGIMREVVNKAMEACPNHATPLMMAADISMRYGQYQKAIEYINRALDMRPNDPSALMQLSHCFRQISTSVQPPESYGYLQEAAKVCHHVRQVAQGHAPEAMSWAMSDFAKIPTPAELQKKA